MFGVSEVLFTPGFEPEAESQEQGGRAVVVPKLNCWSRMKQLALQGLQTRDHYVVSYAVQGLSTLLKFI